MSRLRSRRFIQRSGTENYFYMSRPPTDKAGHHHREDDVGLVRLHRPVARAPQSGGHTRPTSERHAIGRVCESCADTVMRAEVPSTGSALCPVQLQHVTFGRTCTCGYSRLAGSPLRQTGAVVTGVGLCVLFVRSFLERFGDDGLFRPRSVPTGL